MTASTTPPNWLPKHTEPGTVLIGGHPFRANRYPDGSMFYVDTADRWHAVELDATRETFTPRAEP